MRWICKFFNDRAERSYLLSLPAAVEFTNVVLDASLGRNVVATKNIAAGTFLGVYPGTKLTLQAYLDKHELLDNAVRNGYRLSEDTIVDPTDIFGYLPDAPNNRLALINEAPPGGRLNVVALATRNNVWYLAICDIAPGDSLYTFYGASYARRYASSVEGECVGVDFSDAEIALLKQAGKTQRWLEIAIESLLGVYFESKEEASRPLS